MAVQANIRAEVARAMSEAAAAWLAGLDDEQRALGRWGPPGGEDEEERRRWFYTPTDHGGLTLAQQRPAQQRQAMRLLAAALSPQGHDLVATILGWENILDRFEGFSIDFHAERGRDPSRYYLRVFGDPGGDGPWAWRFGGHHVALSFLVADGEVQGTTPRFFGSDPAIITLPGGARLAPLDAFQRAGRELVEALPAAARAAAILIDRAPADIVMANRTAFQDGATMVPLPGIFRRVPGDERLQAFLGEHGRVLEEATRMSAADHAAVAWSAEPKGVAGADLGPAEQALLDRLVAVYHDALPAGLAPGWDVERLHFAWAGSTQVGAPHYYRVQGEDLLIEWDNTSREGNHAHAAVRHRSDDFGAAALARHHHRG